MFPYYIKKTLIFIVILSVAYFTLPSDSIPQTIIYKGLEYKKVNDYWEALNIDENITIASDRIAVKFLDNI